MVKETDILRAEIDGLLAENLSLRAELAALKSELTSLGAGLDDKIQAVVLQAWSNMMQTQAMRGNPPGTAFDAPDETAG